MTVREVHPTAVIHPDATLDDVEVGPFAVIGAGVQLDAEVQVGAHAVLEGPMRVGERTLIDHHAVLGGPAQDTRNDPLAPTRLEIGPGNVFRAHTTAHRGSSVATGVTRIGAGNVFMVGSHVGHDAVVGNGVVLANGVALGGHVTVGDGAFLGGLAAVHQHVRVGRLAMVAGAAVCTQDVPPFAMVQGDRACFVGLNRVGLTRAGIPAEAQAAIKRAYRRLYDGPGPRDERVAALAESDEPLVREVHDFVKVVGRGLCRPRSAT
ncbi:MAG: acyl-ACP--UDP-N-acetylglucosamine O-acyltransferase [Myxococcota bacterium]